VNNRATILASLILILGIATNLILEQDDEELPPVASSQNDPDLYMLNATITQFDTKGTLQHKIRADRFTHFPLTDVTSLIYPKLQLFSDSRTEPWDIEAKNGRLLSQSVYREEIVELWDNVLAVQQSDAGHFINIQTQSLTIYPEREYAETDQKVYIDDNSGRTSAAGMKAFFHLGKFIFYSTPTERVHTIFLPEFKRHPD
jgi:lipopolysaccharide export system protein LptC